MTAEPDGFHRRLAERRRIVEAELLDAAGDASLCAISRSSGRVDGVKHLEGRLAALVEVERALRRGPATADEVVATVRTSWCRELDGVLERSAGPAWIAYRSGGVDELTDLTA